ncbi:MAG: hypothetical protein DRN20_05855 [Thermoplasmata archaeon]|nr:MAG: hypothetical protein DRN20_05855 [Thermoplasmata archaeon]
MRENALKRAQKFGKKLFGKNFETMVMDARNAHMLGRRFDIVLLYGLSTPHFSPWDIVKLYSSATRCLKNHGIFVVEETDRRLGIFINKGYKWALVESGGVHDRFTMSFHAGYDVLRGMIRRVYFDPANPAKFVPMDIFMWGIAEVAAMAWVFFEDVDLIALENTRHFILGKRPRKALRDIKLEEPSCLRKN